MRIEKKPEKYIRYENNRFVLVVSGDVVLKQDIGETFAEFEKRAAEIRTEVKS